MDLGRDTVRVLEAVAVILKDRSRFLDWVADRR